MEPFGKGLTKEQLETRCERPWRDLTLPAVDGLEALRSLRVDPLPKFPIPAHLESLVSKPNQWEHLMQRAQFEVECAIAPEHGGRCVNVYGGFVEVKRDPVNGTSSIVLEGATGATPERLRGELQGMRVTCRITKRPDGAYVGTVTGELIAVTETPPGSPRFTTITVRGGAEEAVAELGWLGDKIKAKAAEV